MQSAHSSASAEAAKEAIHERATEILKKTDGLGVLKPGTVGYLVAHSAVENALREANWTNSKS